MSTNKRETKGTKRATEYLDRVLCDAVESGADTVELERVPEGLEICFLAGGSGMGIVLEDRKLEAELIGLIVRRAGIRDRPTGKMNWKIEGENRTIAVEEYDSFGESCFRLKLDRPRRRPRRQ